MVGGKLLNL